jgi:putative hemolysin
MLIPSLILFFLFLLLSAFFSSSETAFIASNPVKLDYLEREGSKRAHFVKKLLGRVDNLLATILVGNTLVNTAAASVATYLFVSYMPENTDKAVLLATVVTTFLILIFSEITPKTYAAHNPVKLSMVFVRPVQFFVLVLFPVVKVFTLLTGLVFPSQKKRGVLSRTLSEEEIKVLFAMGVRGMSALRKRMISGVLDFGSRPIREIMVPRPNVKAIEIGSTPQQMLDLLQAESFSRFPVYRDQLDNIEGIIHAKEVIPYLIENKDITIESVLRDPLFVPESVSIEKVMLMMQERATHMIFVVDEFGNMEGIVTLEDIIEEIVGEIQDEYDEEAVKLIVKEDEGIFVVKGNTPIKELNQRIPVVLPVKGEYTTVAGFFLDEFGRIPREGEKLEYRGHTFFVAKMKKRHIDCIRITVFSDQKGPANEAHREE